MRDIVQFRAETLAKLNPGIIKILVILFLITGCKNKEERITSLYGTVTDQNQQPVDSILVTASGLWDLHTETIAKEYTDENGKYEIVIDVDKKYSKVNVVIPYFPIENPKFQSYYNIDKIWKNDEQTNSCCTASIGQKTKYNFQLKHR